MIRWIGRNFRTFSNWMSTYENLVAVYAALGIFLCYLRVDHGSRGTDQGDQIYCTDQSLIPH